MYTIKELANLAGISTRTLRHYDTINLLVPSRKKNGYRYYDESDLDMLQAILFYKELGYELKEIHIIIKSNHYNIITSLMDLEAKLQNKVSRLDKTILSIQKTIKHKKGVINMTNKEKFEALKNKKIEENMTKYGKELNETYDPKTISEANKKYKSKTQYEMTKHNEFTLKLNKVMIQAFNENNPQSEIANTMCEMHKEWIMFYWPTYNKDAHLGLVKMYTEDERFKKYYDDIIPGLADFLYKSMLYYTK